MCLFSFGMPTAIVIDVTNVTKDALFSEVDNLNSPSWDSIRHANRSCSPVTRLSFRSITQSLVEDGTKTCIQATKRASESMVLRFERVKAGANMSDAMSCARSDNVRLTGVSAS